MHPPWHSSMMHSSYSTLCGKMAEKSFPVNRPLSPQQDLPQCRGEGQDPVPLLRSPNRYPAPQAGPNGPKENHMAHRAEQQADKKCHFIAPNTPRQTPTTVNWSPVDQQLSAVGG